MVAWKRWYDIWSNRQNTQPGVRGHLFHLLLANYVTIGKSHHNHGA